MSTTTNQLRDAIVDTLTQYLPVELTAAGYPDIPVMAMSNEMEIRAEQLPAVFVQVTGFGAQRERIGHEGAAECPYDVAILFAVKSMEGFRDLDTWASAVADCLRCVIEKYYTFGGMVADANVTDCQFVTEQHGNLSVRIGNLSVSCVVERTLKTTGAE